MDANCHKTPTKKKKKKKKKKGRHLQARRVCNVCCGTSSQLSRAVEKDDEDDDDDLKEVATEKITMLYGDDADQKTLEELQNDEKFAEIENFLSAYEFTNNVANYVQHSESSSGDWFWPLVKTVTIKIPDCHELLEHIVLLDIPGSGDCSRTRDDLWKSKLRECSSVWIVSEIKRAISDRDPWGILKHCIEELGPGGKCKSINFICTKTDDFNPKEYMRKYSTDNQFQVFTVSSKAFFDDNLNLKSSETEIPNLQDDLRNINESINRELTRDYVNKAKGVLSLIQSGQLDTDKKMIEMKVNIRNEFEKNLMKALIELDKYFDSIYKDLEQRLSNGVEESVQSCVASTKKCIAPKKDGRGFHKILGALCRNYGCYWSKNWNVILDLNKSLAEHLHKYVEEYFCQIFPATEKTGKSMQEQIDKFSIIQSDSAYPSSEILHHIQDFIKTEETKLKATLNRDIVEMKKDIYSSIQITIENEMSSCYQQAAALTGTGSMKKRQDLLITTVDEIKQVQQSKNGSAKKV
ncbi:nuclear GTPase SLIP-GC-like [Sinocyclocheilus grahami]|uniref:nuclear GTPase SLIP-GC-like n=1 Tax=Sinocyclocheilus grahami TaxID=75366 RepID=UPI0007AD4056|nr:PREDICTED: nuclear GTPase SLIP-GC-like [Sinocyclocheilus grahami]